MFHILDSKEPNYLSSNRLPCGGMNFSIEKGGMLTKLEDPEYPYQLIKHHCLYQPEMIDPSCDNTIPNIFTINRMMNQIARTTRRGKANYMIISLNLDDELLYDCVEKVASYGVKKIFQTDYLDPDEIIVFYDGTQVRVEQNFNRLKQKVNRNNLSRMICPDGWFEPLNTEFYDSGMGFVLDGDDTYLWQHPGSNMCNWSDYFQYQKFNTETNK
jgi:hypothetical protein